MTDRRERLAGWLSRATSAAWPSASAVTDRLPGSPTPSPETAVRATVLAFAALGMFLSVQGAVATAFVAGGQPMATVERVPMDPTAPAWEQAPARELTLKKQFMVPPRGGGSTGSVQVKALTNETHVAIRLRWTDPTRDANITAPRAYSDAAAVMLHGGSSPPVTMGAVGTPVNIWYWRASWRSADARSEWTGDMYTYPHNDSLTMPGRQAGNPLSQATYERHAQNYYAKGYGSLSAAPVQNVRARAVRTDDGWMVTFVRRRSTGGTYDAQFDGQKTVYLTVAVWNGSKGEVDGQKSLSYQFLKLDTKTGELSVATQASPAAKGGPGGGGPGGFSLPGGDSSLVHLVAGAAMILFAVVLGEYWRARDREG